MQRSMLFEAVLVLLVIVLLSALYVAISSGPVSESGRSEGWTVSGIIAAPSTDIFMAENGMGNMFAGENGTLYTIDGRRIYALGNNGSCLWSLAIPDRYLLPSYGNGSGTITKTSGQLTRTYHEEIKDNVVVTSGQPWNSYSAITNDGNLLIILKPGSPVIVTGVLLSVASNGSIIWSIPFANGHTGNYHYQYGLGNPEGMVLHDGVLYVYSSYGGGVTLVDLNGSISRSIENIGKPAIGDDGTLYVRNGTPYASDPGTHGYFAPLLEAYSINGTLIWSCSYHDLGINETTTSTFMLDNQPYLRNGTLYVWSNDGVAALDLNGSLRFRYHVPEGFITGCGFDQNDTLYLSYRAKAYYPFMYNESGIAILRSDGTVVKSQYSLDLRYYLVGVQEVPDGIFYRAVGVMPYEPNSTSGLTLDEYYYTYTTFYDSLVLEYLKKKSGNWDFPRGLWDLDTTEITAVDLLAGERLWSYRIPLDPHEVVLEPENAGNITMDEDSIYNTNYASYDQWYISNGIPAGSTGIRSNFWTNLMMCNDTLYTSMWSYNYEYPPFYGRARCVYSGGIYAFSLDGVPKWSISTDSRVIAVQEVNGTIYYGTGSGRVSAARAGAVVGVVTVAVYLFLRFFLFGTVTRARLKKNENRSLIFQYILENPGVSLFDIAQALAMNPGTVRYHLMILGMNHRITSFKADEKFVRYFVNSGTYGQGDQLVISLMRREPLRRIIDLLRERPGLSNLEMSRALDAHESSTMRNVKLLIEKGIVAKSLMPDGKISYSLSSEYIVRAASALRVPDK